MTGGMADLLAVHQPDDFHLCTCGFALTWGESGTFPDFDRQHVEHVEAVLTAAGYGDTRALKDFAQTAIDALAAWHTLTRRHGIPESHALLVRHTPEEQ